MPGVRQPPWPCSLASIQWARTSSGLNEGWEEQLCESGRFADEASSQSGDSPSTWTGLTVTVGSALTEGAKQIGLGNPADGLGRGPSVSLEVEEFAVVWG